jgi:ubiquinone/menaquinone biosynthesis C-methylase UbiE
MTDQMTERQRREREYYNQYGRSFDPYAYGVDMSPVTGPLSGKEYRPWNSYWAIYELAIAHFQEGKRLLDFGTGSGDNALRFAHIGYVIEGFDISEINIKNAQRLFAAHNQCGNFQVAIAEALPYPDEHFDIIVGIDILHHVDISKAIRECHRVLKPGGKAFFREPVDVPVLDAIRNTRLVRFFVPKEVSLEKHITADERKLNALDQLAIQEIFPKLKTHIANGKARLLLDVLLSCAAKIGWCDYLRT